MNKMFSIYKFEKISSTNTKARNFKPGSVIVAAEQTKGKGRFDRKWSSSKGGLWASIVLKPNRKVCEYTFITSLAVHDSLDIDTGIKWPNDLYYKDKKLCGILTEIFSYGNEVAKIVVGIGINVNNKPPSEGISLKEILGKEVDGKKLLEKILLNFEKLSKLSTATVIRRYKESCLMMGQKAIIKTLKGEFKGIVKDIDYEGKLILKTKDGIKRLDEGDSSII